MDTRSVDSDEANKLLLELDKGLRAPDVGDQCEAIVGFSRLLDRFPLPVIVTSAVLKLADEFRTKNNLIRAHVMNVFSQSAPHLSKLLNTDEVIKRVFSVSHSNDPLARALTLTVLGCLASVAPDKKTIHHCILDALSSVDDKEVEAAIAAAQRYSALSKDFAHALCAKLQPLLQSYTLSPATKLRLLPLLGYMHHDVDMASKARAVALDLLAVEPTHTFVEEALTTLSRLSLQSVLNISEQVRLLVDFARADPRTSVRCCALDNLASLASMFPYVADAWSPDNTTRVFFRLAREDLQASVRVRALVVLRSLASAPQLFSSAFGWFVDQRGANRFDNHDTRDPGDAMQQDNPSSPAVHPFLEELVLFGLETINVNHASVDDDGRGNFEYCAVLSELLVHVLTKVLRVALGSGGSNSPYASWPLDCLTAVFSQFASRAPNLSLANAHLRRLHLSRARRLLQSAVALCSAFPFQLTALALQMCVALAACVADPLLQLLYKCCTALLSLPEASSYAPGLQSLLCDLTSQQVRPDPSDDPASAGTEKQAPSVRVFAITRLLLESSSRWKFNTDSNLIESVRRAALLGLGQLATVRARPQDRHAPAGPTESGVAVLLSFVAVARKDEVWSLFELGKHSLLHGHYELSMSIFQALGKLTSSEQTHNWLSALELVAAAEADLSSASLASSNGVPHSHLQQAVRKMRQAMVKLKASATAKFPWTLQSKILKLRCKWLTLLRRFASILALSAPSGDIAANELSTAPSAIPEDQVLPVAVLYEAQQCFGELARLRAEYSELVETLFDMDSTTSHILDAHQLAADALSEAINRLVTAAPERADEQTQPSRQLEQDGSPFGRLREAVHLLPEYGTSLAEKHAIISQLFYGVLLVATVPVPPLFFSSRKFTTVEITVTPPAVDSMLVSKSADLLLKIEGIVQQQASASRSVREVLLVIECTSIETDVENGSFQPLSFKAAEEIVNEFYADSAKGQETVATASNLRLSSYKKILSAAPSATDGYFSATCPLQLSALVQESGFSAASTKHVSVAVLLKDTRERIWNSGPRVAFLMRYDI